MLLFVKSQLHCAESDEKRFLRKWGTHANLKQQWQKALNKGREASMFLRLAVFVNNKFKWVELIRHRLNRAHGMENTWNKRGRFLTDSPTMLSVRTRPEYPNTGSQSWEGGAVTMPMEESTLPLIISFSSLWGQPLCFQTHVLNQHCPW